VGKIGKDENGDKLKRWEEREMERREGIWFWGL